MQWNTNDGYCGETSFVSAGLHYGQYTSQWTARDAAAGLPTPPIDQADRDAQIAYNQLMLGTPNALVAAREMRLTATGFDSRSEESSRDFLVWAKRNVVAGNVVIIGVYENSSICHFGGGSCDPTFDHIVPVISVGSHHPLAGDSLDTYYPDDTITISDNGLHTVSGEGNAPGQQGCVNPQGSSLYTYGFSSFIKTRSQATRSSDFYSLPEKNDANLRNYGAVVTGIAADTDAQTLPVTMTSDTNSEGYQNQTTMARPPTARLGASISDSATSISVEGLAAGSYFPPSPLHVLVGTGATAELMRVQEVRGSGSPYTYNVVRGQGGTRASQHDAEEPVAVAIQLTASVAIADQSQTYKVYLYDDLAEVPTSDFNSPANAAKATKMWTIDPDSGETWTVALPPTATTDSTQVIRAVPATAP